MKGFAITHKGAEDISAKEIKELINSGSEVEESICIFDIKGLGDLCLLCYKGQSFIKVLYFINNFKFNNFDDLIKKVNNKNILDEVNKWIKNKTYKIDCKRVGEHNFNSQDVSIKINEIINKKKQIEYDNPDVIVFIYLYKNNFYIGIDFSWFDLSKRDYKIFHNPRSLKGTIGYTLIRTADYKKGEVLLDPFCTDGVIPIEAALFASQFPVNYYRKEKLQFLKIKELKNYNFDKLDKEIKLDKKQNILAYDGQLRNISAAKKNAKIAGIQKQIGFARMDIEWLDTKLNKESVDKIITNPPVITEINKKNMEKLYKEFFYQCNFILKKNGKIVLITKNSESVKNIALKNKFKIEKEVKIEVGKENLDILVIKLVE